MGEIFDKYKTLEGWLEIKIDTYNPFWVSHIMIFHQNYNNNLQFLVIYFCSLKIVCKKFLLFSFRFIKEIVWLVQIIHA